MYIYVLDYLMEEVTIEEIPSDIDIEDYVDKSYGLSNVEYMTSSKLNFNIKNYKWKQQQ